MVDLGRFQVLTGAAKACGPGRRKKRVGGACVVSSRRCSGHATHQPSKAGVRSVIQKCTGQGKRRPLRMVKEAAVIRDGKRVIVKGKEEERSNGG